MNLAAQIHATPYKPTLASVDVPHWPNTAGKLFVRSLNSLQREQYGRLIANNATDRETPLLASIVVLVLVDEHGVPVFDKVDDAAKLGAKDAEPLRIIADAYAAHQRAVEAAEKKRLRALTNGNSTPST